MDAKTVLQLDKIVTGQRVRHDMGDLQSLANSMQRHGLLHPVVVKSDRTLIAGYRRIEAARLLGWTEIPVTIIDVDDLLSAERDENAERKDFTPTEAVAIGRLIEEQHMAKIAHHAKSQRIYAARVRVAKRTGSEPPKRSFAVFGDTVAVAAKAVSMGATAYREAKRVVNSAELDPKTFGDLPTMMDETGAVHTAHQEMLRRKTGTGRGNPALRKMRHLQPNREVERAVLALDGICVDLRAEVRADFAAAAKRRNDALEAIGFDSSLLWSYLQREYETCGACEGTGRDDAGYDEYRLRWSNCRTCDGGGKVEAAKGEW